MELFSGLFGLLVLIADIYAIIQVLSSRSSGIHKLIWILLIVLLPVIGLVIWLLAGPRSASRAAI